MFCKVLQRTLMSYNTDVNMSTENDRSLEYGTSMSTSILCLQLESTVCGVIDMWEFDWEVKADSEQIWDVCGIRVLMQPTGAEITAPSL